ncbi:hypothetical protein Moror_4061 [Moniliophthora roreri MCA 2997]|uniref:Uncharacterized protein n=1 Tax=Moniliophthora roreri (strain MCA 2997) TaxID=1381753 RepID=V2YGG2_MONRO|nr:hypothetical protein Moror_4061 [Moniliophthora roreri MCA 2997]
MVNTFRNRVRKQLFQSAIEATREQPLQVMQRVFQHMRANDPFSPPVGRCPIDSLPNELLAHIFELGKQMDDYDIEDFMADARLQVFEDNLSRLENCVKSFAENGTQEDQEDEMDAQVEGEDGHDLWLKLPFQVIASHVCRRWREVSVQTATLWTQIIINSSSTPARTAVWIERSKDMPLTISMACMTDKMERGDIDDQVSLDDDIMDGQMHNDHALTWSDSEDAISVPGSDDIWPDSGLNHSRISEFLEIILPHIGRWQTFIVGSDIYERLHLILECLAQCDCAPMLKKLMFVHALNDDRIHEDRPGAYVPFEGNTPQLEVFSIGGMGLDWDSSLLTPLWSGRLLKLTFAFQASRPSLETFSRIIASAESLEHLNLYYSGPQLDIDSPAAPIYSNSITRLQLRVQEPRYIEKLFPMFVFPNLVTLDIHFDEDDGEYTDFVDALCRPLPGRSESTLFSLRQLLIYGLPCSFEEYPKNILEQLVNLRELHIESDKWIDLLLDDTGREGELEEDYAVKYCPNLEKLYTWGPINGERLKHLVQFRKYGGSPLKEVRLCSRYPGRGMVDKEHEKWLKENLDIFGFFKRAEDYLSEQYDQGTLSVDEAYARDSDPEYWRKLVLEQFGMQYRPYRRLLVED